MVARMADLWNDVELHISLERSEITASNAIRFGFREAYVRPNYVFATGVTRHRGSRTMAHPSRRAMSHWGFARTRSEGSVAAT